MATEACPEDTRYAEAEVIAPLRPDHPCRQCGCEDFWLRLRGGIEWICDRCHPNPDDEECRSASTRKEYPVHKREYPEIFLHGGVL